MSPDGLVRQGPLQLVMVSRLVFRGNFCFGNRPADSGTIIRQTKAVEKIRAEFEEQGVDFEQFWDGVGGVEGMPGMEITT